MQHAKPTTYSDNTSMIDPDSYNTFNGYSVRCMLHW